MKTNQEIFDIVAAHLLKQGVQCKDGLSCVYRGADNTKCAVGVLIKDQDYHKNMEGESIDEVKDYLVEHGPQLPPESELLCKPGAYLIYEALKANEVDCEQPEVLSLLGELQSCHDNEAPLMWEVELQRIAVNHKLNFNHVQA
jgi:hypothetical protein